MFSSCTCPHPRPSDAIPAGVRCCELARCCCGGATPPPTIEQAHQAAVHRYLNDPMFHARVERGVIAAGQSGCDFSDRNIRQAAVHAVVMALYLNDLTPAPIPQEAL
jgi:hypothetical protein